jgi:hypothetical protein
MLRKQVWLVYANSNLTATEKAYSDSGCCNSRLFKRDRIFTHYVATIARHRSYKSQQGFFVTAVRKCLASAAAGFSYAEVCWMCGWCDVVGRSVPDITNLADFR